MENSLKNGTCPKCNHQEIYSIEAEIHKILPHTFGHSMSWENRPSPVVDNFICGHCGYAEFFVRPTSLETVKKNWDRK